MSENETTNDTAAKLLTIPQVCDILGISRPTLYTWMAAGKFPRPVKLATRTARYRRGTVDDFIVRRETGENQEMKNEVEA